jgi:hypothetical protein
MGAKNDKTKSADMSSYGWLYLQIYKGSYCPGEVVRGVIHMNLVKTFPGSQLILKLKGKEYVYYTYITWTRGLKVRREAIFQVNKHDVVNYEIPMIESEDGQDLEPDQISIPFAIKLPTKLPGSFFLSQHNLCAAISYHLEVIIREPDTANRLKYKSRIFIREPPQVMPTTMIPKEINQELTTCCCCKAGSLAMKVVFEKNSYMPGEICRATVNLDLSNTKEEVKTVVLNMKQVVSIVGPWIKEYTVMTKTVDGPKKGEKFENQVIELQLPPAECRDIWDLPKENIMAYIKKTPDIGASCIDKVNNTTVGEIVESRFYVEIIVKFATYCCALVAEADINVDICAAEVEPMGLPSIPQDWTPDELEEQVYLDPSEYFMKGQEELNNFSSENPLMAPMTGNQGMTNPNQNILSSPIERIPRSATQKQTRGGYKPVARGE